MEELQNQQPKFVCSKCGERIALSWHFADRDCTLALVECLKCNHSGEIRFRGGWDSDAFAVAYRGSGPAGPLRQGES